MTTYTIDASKDGVLYEDHGVTEQELENAMKNAPRLGIIILSVTREDPVDPGALSAFGPAGVNL